MSAAARIARALGGKPYGDAWIIRCPAPDHGAGRGDRRPSCVVRDGDVPGRVLFKCFAACTRQEILAALRARGLLENAQSPGVQPHRHLKPAAYEALRPEPNPDPNALRMWLAAKPIRGTIAEIYLREHRGITLDLPPSLRFDFVCHPATGLQLPAMIAAIGRPTDRKIVAVQATFLTLDGSKAPMATPRLTFGTLGTGAIRLGQCDDVLGIAEGTETALAATELAGVPCWSSVGAARLHTITVPDSVSVVHVFGDNDPTGQVAAEKVAEKHTREGRKVHLRFPPKNCNDYNDALIARAKKVAA